LEPGGTLNDLRWSVIYNANSGELALDIPEGHCGFTSMNIESETGIFTGQPALNVDGPFDVDADHIIFKAVFGGSFHSLSFGAVAQAGLPEMLVLDDLTAIGSGEGGCDPFFPPDLIYVPVPEPNTLVLLSVGFILAPTRRQHRPAAECRR
jgi:hypothetical protein